MCLSLNCIFFTILTFNKHLLKDSLNQFQLPLFSVHSIGKARMFWKRDILRGLRQVCKYWCSLCTLWVSFASFIKKISVFSISWNLKGNNYLIQTYRVERVFSSPCTESWSDLWSSERHWMPLPVCGCHWKLDSYRLNRSEFISSSFRKSLGWNKKRSGWIKPSWEKEWKYNKSEFQWNYWWKWKFGNITGRSDLCFR